MVMADHHVVDVLNLEGLVIEAVLFALNAEEDAVVDKGLAGVCGGSSTTPISRITLASFTNILALPRPPILRTLINLDVKQMGARSAGNPHAACDAEGAGNVARPRYWDTRRRKGEPTGETNFGLNRRASPRPYR
jgi:hypothetical protein